MGEEWRTKGEDGEGEREEREYYTYGSASTYLASANAFSFKCRKNCQTNDSLTPSDIGSSLI